jgi:hypothetical protein
MKKDQPLTKGWKFNVGETITEFENSDINMEVVSRGPFVSDRMKVKEVYIVKSPTGPTLFTLNKDEVDRHYKKVK